MTWETSGPILFFLGLSVLDLGPMYATDRQTSSDAHHRLMPPPYGGGIISEKDDGLILDADSYVENFLRLKVVRPEDNIYGQ